MKVTIEFIIVREYSPMLCTWHAGILGCQNPSVLFRVVEIFSAWNGEKLGYRTPSGYPGIQMFFRTLEEVEHLLREVLAAEGGAQVLQSSGLLEHEMFREVSKFVRNQDLNKD